MAWMNVSVHIENKPSVPNVLNIDTIVRYGANPTGSYIRTVDGLSINVDDSVDEISAVILKAQASEK